MTQFIYVDETGSVGKGAKRQPYLILAAAIVDEENVQALSTGLRAVAKEHLGWVPPNLEFHGREIWHGSGPWAGKTNPELIAAYETALALLDTCDISLAYSSIDKARLTARYGGAADANAYRLGLQFLLEKVDRLGSGRKVVVADEAKEQELGALKMVADMQDWGGGEVPGRKLTTVIDSLHFVSSHASPGVQMADLVAFVLQRQGQKEHHPEAQAGMGRLNAAVNDHLRTWREPWPK